MRKLLITAAVIGALVPAAALAQQGTVTGAAGGAVTGAIVGGPVGAAVGGVAGATVGTILAPPPEVRTYVTEEQQPSVTIQQDVVVGQPLPEEVIVYPVPRYKAYRYAIVNGQRVIIDSGSRRVVQIIR